MKANGMVAQAHIKNVPFSKTDKKKTRSTHSSQAVSMIAVLSLEK